VPGDVGEAQDGHGQRDLARGSDRRAPAQRRDFLADFDHRGRPQGRLLREHSLHERLDLRHASVILAGGERWRRAVKYGVENLDGVLAPKRRLPTNELVEQRPERVHVGPGVNRLSAGLLRRHVGEGAEQRARPGLGGVPAPGRAVGGAEDVLLGEAEVQDLEPAVRGYHDVRRLDVAVHDAAGVGLPEGLRDAVDDVEGLVERR
jgi:hypothetical protein